MAREFDITVRDQGPVTLFDIKGDVNRSSGPLIEEAYAKRDTAQDRKILLVFHRKTYFNSEGIETLIQLLAKARKNHQAVGITGLSKHFKKIFHMVGISSLATIFSSVREGIEGLAGPAKDKD